ncbi:Hypothetical predicted protein [Mytilus galloprovincialis]|uniref:OTU domain-containing protein n=1 Tax=Mytilus galloprovincialis TaxID=29158 RepID=A0A8B6GDE3_MYTGA|nr:Hypothetical predicted protein [Mytilus galloprovincialis]
MELLPDDVKKEGYFPASVLGDGICLPRSVSVIMYGTEKNHTELRARIALELACYLPLYVDHTYVRRGEQLFDKEALVLPKSYVMYSELYTPGDIITSSLIERTLFEEIRKVCSANEFMGIWQLFALASVLGRPLQSVYPNRGNPNYDTTADQHSLLDELTDNQSSMTVKPMDVQPFASVQPDEALMSNLQDKSKQSNISSVVSKDETTADQHSLLDEQTDNQSSMTVKHMDVHPFALVQPEVALKVNRGTMVLYCPKRSPYMTCS